MRLDPGRLRSIREHAEGDDSWRAAVVAPPPALAGLINGYTDYAERTASFNTRRELPHAQGVLIVNLDAPIEIVDATGRVTQLKAGEAFVAGPHLGAALSRSTGAQAGMHVFLPLESLRRLLGVPMEALRDQVVSLDAVLGAAATGFCRSLAAAERLPERIALLDAALTRRFARMPALPAAQQRALHLLRRRPDLDLASVAREVGWSRKHFASRMTDALGVGPRTYRRLLRFERAVAAVSRGGTDDGAGLALDAGYCDQSHLIREFREFAGLTPGEFLRRSLPDGGGVVER